MAEIINCANCGKETYAEMIICPHCSKKTFKSDSKEKWLAPIEKAKETGDWSELPAAIVAEYASGIVLTTSFQLPQTEIAEIIEVISAECAFGMNVFRDIFAGVRDIIGGRSAATQKVLRDARRTCLAELRREALMVGADAVIGVDLDYSEFSGGSKSMLLLVVSGTAVKIRK